YQGTDIVGLRHRAMPPIPETPRSPRPHRNDHTSPRFARSDLPTRTRSGLTAAILCAVAQRPSCPPDDNTPASSPEGPDLRTSTRRGAVAHRQPDESPR